MTITEILARNARLYPDAPALTEITPSKNLRKTITWKEFDERANQVANALIAMGVKKGERVAALAGVEFETVDGYGAQSGFLNNIEIHFPQEFDFDVGQPCQRK